MNDVAIRCEGLGKRYRIGERERYKALRDVITDAAASPFRKLRNAVMGKRQGASNGNGNEATSLTASPLPLSPPDGNGHSASSLITHDSSLLSQRPISDLGSPTSDLFWALKDVSFEVKRGEVVGIIGRNGAGKSTLLKILSRITAPTEGEVEVRGRVGSLLEVGTGFHPELTGRENIYLNGAILGMKRAEINRKFDEIVAFAEIEKFIDTPVKRYSSGMYVRLAFAVAAHLEPEILVVDEVLAVGDAQFQKKCLGKMGDVAKEGRTVLFVSHDLTSIQTLCSRAIYLANGEVVGFGDVRIQISTYLRDCSERRSLDANSLRLTKHLELRKFCFSPNPAPSGSPVRFEIELYSSIRIRLTELVILIYTPLGKRGAILDLRSSALSRHLTQSGTARIIGKVKALPFVEGDYQIGLYLNCEDIRRDFYDLFTLTVSSVAKHGQMVPYAAVHRGIVELEFDLTSSFSN